MNLKVDVLIVTFNRKELLLKTIKKVCLQTFRARNIVIVDNHSSDGTYEHLCEQLALVKSGNEEVIGCDWYNTLEKDDVKFKYYYKSENDGGAGGFAFGMSKAIAMAADALWIMDDDGFPEPDCLSELTNVFEEGKIEYVAPRLLTFEGAEHFHVDNIKLICSRGIGGPFNGILVSTRMIREVGVPRKDFFIWGDEREWLHRVVNAGFVTVIANKAIHLHKSTAFNWSKAPRVFHLVRNLVWTARLNESVNINKYTPWLDLLYHVRKLFIRGLISGNLNQIRMIMLGILHGLTKRLK